MTLTRTYSVRGLEPLVAAQLRRADDAGRRPTVVVDREGGSPLRCCLHLSRPGETILLVSYAPLRRWCAEHGADPAAYDEVGPIFIHPDGCPGPDGDGWPAELRGRPRVLRTYDANGRLIGGRLVAAADDPDQVIAELAADPHVALVHARAVVAGCFTFRVELHDRRPDRYGR